ncbi:MAG: exodeoxyribonuclease III [Rhodothermales bacterium]|nr:exodeoxyribonuclease III [Rhodothermales bacterium]
MIIKVATWNVNSIKARLERALAWLEKAEPNVVCLQELKVTDEDFPADELAEAGYHAAVHGQRTYNGVAILSRDEITDVSSGMGDGVKDPQARVVRAKTYGIDVVSVYVPNGREVGSDKWEYKLKWFQRFHKYLDRTFSNGGRLAIGGDFNVAPEDRDVANPDKWRESVLCHEGGREKLKDLIHWGLVDTVRIHNDEDGPYSWWDYRRLAFPKGDGLRIDHILATKKLAQKCVDAYVDRDERKGKKPSDHAPVIAEFEI